MKQIWIVQSNEDRYAVVDVFDNEAAAKDCVDFYRDWNHKCYSIDIESAFLKPDDWEDYDD